jgi:small subunit ribosomal protein S11
MAQKKKGGKKEKKVVHSGEAYIQATFNNTVVTITDQNGNVITWSSAGAQGFGLKERDAICCADSCRYGCQEGIGFGMRQIDVYVKGPELRESLSGRFRQQVLINLIKDVTPVPHNGTKPPKRRRV